MSDSSGPSDLERGIALARQGQPAAAYADLRRALFTEGDSATLRLWLASVAPTPAESILHLERAQALEPGNLQVAAALDQARERLDPLGAPPAPVWPGGSAAWPPPDQGGPSALPTWAVEAPPGARPAPGAPPVGGGRAPDPLQPHTVFSTLPRAPLGAPAAAPPYPGALVTPPSYGVFEEAQEDLVVPPGSAAPPASPALPRPGAAASRPPARPAPARRRGLPLLLGALVLLALCALAGLALNTGLLSAALTPATPAPALLTQTAAGVVAQAATATAGAVAVATRTAAPAATARAGGHAYHAAVVPLLDALHTADGEIANLVHGADDGVIAAPTAGRRLESYIHENANYQTQAANLDVPVAWRSHALQVQTALTLRGQALGFAAQYVARLRDLADAVAAHQDAQRTYNDAATAYDQANTQARYVDLLRAKQDLDATTSQLDRLRTYADQNHQQFLTAWDQYHATLPDAPPP